MKTPILDGPLFTLAFEHEPPEAPHPETNGPASRRLEYRRRYRPIVLERPAEPDGLTQLRLPFDDAL